MGQAGEWFEDDNFWEVNAPVMFHERRRAATPEEVDHVLDLLSIEPPAAVLDLCCGPGRHAIELARRGFRVTGVDRTARYLKQAGSRAAEDGVNVEFVCEDMRRFCRDEAFDAVINMFTSFGYFENQDDDRQVLANLHRSLKPHGRLAIDIVGKEILARIYRPRDWQQMDNGNLILEERTITRDWTWMQNRWILIDGEEKHEFHFNHRLYSAAELSGLLRDCGFNKVDIYGNLAGAPYDHQAQRLVAVAEK